MFSKCEESFRYDLFFFYIFWRNLHGKHIHNLTNKTTTENNYEIKIEKLFYGHAFIDQPLQHTQLLNCYLSKMTTTGSTSITASRNALTVVTERFQWGVILVWDDFPF